MHSKHKYANPSFPERGNFFLPNFHLARHRWFFERSTRAHTLLAIAYQGFIFDLYQPKILKKNSKSSLRVFKKLFRGKNKKFKNFRYYNINFLVIKQGITERYLQKNQLKADFQATKIWKNFKNTNKLAVWCLGGLSQFAGVKTLKKLGSILPQGILYTFGSQPKFQFWKDIFEFINQDAEKYSTFNFTKTIFEEEIG